MVHELFRAHETNLLGPLLRYLDRRNDVRVLGPTDATRRTPTVSIVPLRRPIPDMVATLTGQKMMVGAGDFYAPRLLKGMGITPENGVLRMSFIHYTTEDEINRLVGALDKALR